MASVVAVASGGASVGAVASVVAVGSVVAIVAVAEVAIRRAFGDEAGNLLANTPLNCLADFYFVCDVQPNKRLEQKSFAETGHCCVASLWHGQCEQRLMRHVVILLLWCVGCDLS